ncbi:MAG: ATP-dependent DNA helicase [Armatimonadetes bacterium]|nr:ATP-dependent DNA helicase [Armatimonadota bacterium]MDE2205527.1 ATP-dependent DNA helicase [Armatimonadota bacterium]
MTSPEGRRDAAGLTLSQIFDRGGPLAALLPEYETRTEQLHVAEAVERAFRRGEHCLCEAGTGTGKSLAYLIPAFQSAIGGERTVISTYTINLQTQLMEHDIPLVQRLFGNAGAEIKVTLMKGRGHYFCHQGYDTARRSLFMSSDPGFARLQAWAEDPAWSGDRATLDFLVDGWYDVAANSETCRGMSCDWFSRCHYFNMRRRAAESQILVVNHALFFTDLAMRAEDEGAKLLPEYRYVVFDEAHHLEAAATDAFSRSVNSLQIPALAARLQRFVGIDLDTAALDELARLSNRIFASFGSMERREFFMSDARERCLVRQGDVEEVQAAVTAVARSVETQIPENELLADRLAGASTQLQAFAAALAAVYSDEDTNTVRWGSVDAGFSRRRDTAVTTLSATPVSVGGVLESQLWSPLTAAGGAAVMLSATLANGEACDYTRRQLGLPYGTAECVVGSPFDYRNNAMLYVPRHLPEPKRGADEAYSSAVAGEIARIADATQGRAFALFTSRAALNAAYPRLQQLSSLPLFRQGDLPPQKLIELFTRSGNGLLLGVQTFWEGVDIRGEALSCVIIDRIPFAVPDSPVTVSRTRTMEADGIDSFTGFSVPQAQLRLKQGFGRLIRTAADTGIVCILDTRLLNRRYGQAFLDSLPPARFTSDWSVAQTFCHGLRSSS